MSAQQQQARGGVGFLGLLAILFIGLKLGGLIDWSWWLVLLPLYGPLTLVLAIVAICFAVAGIIKTLERVSR